MREHSLEITLIPLKASSLFLPSVSIQPVDPLQRVTCETQHLAAATTVEALPVLMRSSWEVRGGGIFA